MALHGVLLVFYSILQAISNNALTGGYTCTIILELAREKGLRRPQAHRPTGGIVERIAQENAS
jgi:hypothetical protein